MTSVTGNPSPVRNWTAALRVGGACGLLALYAVTVGIFSAFAARYVIANALTLGHMLILSIIAAAGWITASTLGARVPEKLAVAGLSGVAAGLLYALVLLAAGEANVQGMFVALNGAALKAALIGQTGAMAVAACMVIGVLAGLAGAALALCPARPRSMLLIALGAVLVGALLRDLWISLFSTLLGGRWWVSRIFMSGGGGLTWPGVTLACLGGLAWRGLHGLAGRRRSSRADIAILILAAIIIPLLTNAFIAQVMLLVGLYALMGMGLNIELGLAGLLDLGFVAFFAIGAYVTALLTANSPLAIADLSFWQALPIATLCAAAGGFVFGLPVLRVRGDYLALATLGLGEIVRIIVVSDMAAPIIGGAQGVVGVPRPEFMGASMVSQLSLYYLTLILACLVALAGWRLEHSPVGRAWTAARDDEDVAATLGMDLVQSKLRAYVLGAAFAGVAGALFATTLGSVFPQSLRLDVSINVLALLVVGGLGSLPGVFVGSFILIGLPEFLREFGECRYLLYGFLLILVMRVRPQGLWPNPLSARHG